MIEDNVPGSVEEILALIRSLGSLKGVERQASFGIRNVNNYGLTAPQIRSIAKTIGRHHILGKELWKTGIHEARHIAILISDYRMVTKNQMEQWVKDFNSWDITDNCCGSLFDKTHYAYEKAMEWCTRKKEFEKRAGFTMMATLAIHDKLANDKKFLQFFPYLKNESGDSRKYVSKSINWAIRQIGKRNIRLCQKSILLAKEINSKNDPSSRRISSDALRELNKYYKEGKIKRIGIS